MNNQVVQIIHLTKKKNKEKSSVDWSKLYVLQSIENRIYFR